MWAVSLRHAASGTTVVRPALLMGGRGVRWCFPHVLLILCFCCGGDCGCAAAAAAACFCCCLLLLRLLLLLPLLLHYYSVLLRIAVGPVRFFVILRSL